MAKMRHIALIVPDPEAAAKFFESAFDLKRAGNARRGVYLSDGTINIALLKQEGNEKVGLYHFGMWVDDLDASEKKVLDAGGTYLEGRPTSPNSWRSVVSGGVKNSASGMSSKPTMLIRSGTGMPASEKARSAPIAIWSFATKMAVRPAPSPMRRWAAS